MKEKFDPNTEAEHLRRIMSSRDVAIRDAWTVLKQPMQSICENCHYKPATQFYWGSGYCEECAPRVGNA